jgi:hypothetical protein
MMIPRYDFTPNGMEICRACRGYCVQVDTDVMTGEQTQIGCPYCYGTGYAKEASEMRYEVGKWYTPKRHLYMSAFEFDRNWLAFIAGKAYQCKDVSEPYGYVRARFSSEFDDEHYVGDRADGWYNEFVEADARCVAATILLEKR